jgi:RNA polymerase sigma factor (sigma-70 family)
VAWNTVSALTLSSVNIRKSMFGSRERHYNAWVRDHYRFLYRSAWALTGSRVVAEEVVQDCYELAWRHIHQLRDPALARPWLFQILRREALRNIVPSAGPRFEPYDEETDERTASDPVASLEQRLDILGAMQSMAPIHREVLTLFYFEDMPVAEMALALEVAPGTVLSRLSRAREILRQRMAGNDARVEKADSSSAQVLDFPQAAPRVIRDA